MLLVKKNSWGCEAPMWLDIYLGKLHRYLSQIHNIVHFAGDYNSCMIE